MTSLLNSNPDGLEHAARECDAEADRLTNLISQFSARTGDSMANWTGKAATSLHHIIQVERKAMISSRNNITSAAALFRRAAVDVRRAIAEEKARQEREERRRDEERRRREAEQRK